MNKVNSMQDSSFQKNQSHQESQRITESTHKSDKILCNHCGRTSTNEIRCLGICVADNDY